MITVTTAHEMHYDFPMPRLVTTISSSLIPNNSICLKRSQSLLSKVVYRHSTKGGASRIVPSSTASVGGLLRRTLRDITRNGKGWILITVAGGWFLSIGVRYIYPSMIPFFRDTFGMDLMVAGILLSSLWFAYAFGQFPGGILGDRIGEGRILAVSTALSAVALLIVSSSITIGLVFIGTILFGFASALYATTRFTIFTDIYPDRSGTAVGLTMACGSIGNTVLPPVAVSIGSYLTWRAGFGFLVPLFILSTLAIIIAVPNRTSTTAVNEVESITWETVRRLLSSATIHGIPVVVLVHILLSFASHGFLGFYPTYLIDVKGFSAQTAAIIFGMYFAFGIVLQPIIGIAKDRFGSKLTLGLIASTFFIGLAAVQFGETLLHFVIITVFLSNRNGLGVVTNTYIADALPDDIKGSGLGMLRTVWQFVGATSPVFVGFLGALGHLNTAFIVLAAIAAITIVLTVFVPSGN